LAHITGGGLTENLPRALPDDLGAEIDLDSWERLPIFNWLIAQAGLAQAEALKTFNCGIGMIAIAAADNVAEIEAAFANEGIDAIRIGTIVKGEGVAYLGSL
jgi:phosphoribosylformylglycinamidine cyclo-ligase